MSKFKIFLLLMLTLGLVWFFFGPSFPNKLFNSSNFTTPKEVVLLDGFENLTTWGTSPEQGFDVSLAIENVTQGKYSIKAVYPVGDYPSINTKKLLSDWSGYEEVIVDVFLEGDESKTLFVRLDDTRGKKLNIPYKLIPGKNEVKINRLQLETKLDPSKMHFIAFFFKKPTARITLYFDHMRLEKRVDAGKDGQRMTYDVRDTGEPIPFRKAKPIVKDPAPTQGKVKVALAKIKNMEDNRPLISTGIPFAPGQLKDIRDFVLLDQDSSEIQIAARVLVRWPMDQSIRSVLVQFHYKIPETYEYVTLQWGRQRQSIDLPIIEPVWKYPQGLLIMPKEWLSDSGFAGPQLPAGHPQFSAYDKRLFDKFNELIKKPKKGSIRSDGYYSTAHVYYQLFARTGELRYFIAARKELLHYRDNELILEGEERGRAKESVKPRYIYIEAMLEDYLLTGDPRTFETAGYMAEHLAKRFPPERGFFPQGETYFWTERIVGFPFLGMISYYELTLDQTYYDLAEKYMQNLYRTQMQWPSRGGFIHNLYAHDPEEGARPDEYGGSPFMTGLLWEPIIRWHQLTDSEIAADSLFRSLDWVIKEGLGINGDAVKYLTADAYANSTGEPDMNLLMVHGFGYGFYLSGYENIEYLNVGMDLFHQGISKGYVNKQKHFNQAHRSSGRFLAYVAGAIEQLAEQNDQGRLTEIRRPMKDVLLYESFNDSTGIFTATASTDLSVSYHDQLETGNALKVISQRDGGDLTITLKKEVWNIMEYPKVSFLYRIPQNTPVTLRVKTQMGDWICIAKSAQGKCGAPEIPEMIELNDDNVFNQATFSLKNRVHGLLSGIERVEAIGFYTHNNALKNQTFWIDEFQIHR